MKNELNREGILIPELDDLNFNAILPEDYALAIEIIGKDTTIKMAVEPGFIENIAVSFKASNALLRIFEIIISKTILFI